MPHKDKEVAKEYFKNRYEGNKEFFKDRSRKHHKLYRSKLKEEAIQHYGGKCFCCGEVNLIFLSIDHKNNDGNRHRRELGRASGGSHFYLWLKRHNWPLEFQVACHNCNLGRHINGGICPHKI